MVTLKTRVLLISLVLLLLVGLVALVPATASPPAAGPTPIAPPIEVVVEAGPRAVGYVDSRDTLLNYLGRPIYAGIDSRPQTPRVFHGILQFDLPQLPEQAEIISAQVELKGLTARYLDAQASGTWTLKLLDSAVDANWAGLGYWHIHHAAAEPVGAAHPQPAIGPGVTNEFHFSSTQFDKLLDRMATTRKISFRLDGDAYFPRVRAIFAWDPKAPPILRIKYVMSLTITILDTNDFHGALDTSRTISGRRAGTAAYLAGYFNIVRQENPGGVLLVDAGDTMQGTLISNYFKGASTIDVFNTIGYDVGTVGNHEFDWGVDILKERLQQANYPIVVSNIYLKSNGQRPDWATPYVIETVKGVKIGVLGLGYPDTPTVVTPAFVAHLNFTSGVSETLELVPQMRAEGATITVVDFHQGGFAPDYGDIAKFAKALPPGFVNLIISGHTHSLIATTINGMPVVQAFSSGTAFGRTDFTVSGKDGRVLSYTGPEVTTTYQTEADGSPAKYHGVQVVPDPAVAAVVKTYADQVQVFRNTVVGQTDVALTRNYRCESNIGDVIADAFRAYTGTTGINFAFTNSGGIRQDIPAGSITYGQAFDTMPFGNTLYTIDLTGAQVKEALEQGVTGKHGVVQVSGLRFTFNYDLPMYSRVVGDVIDTSTGQPIDPAATYRVVVNSFMASGGDEYTVLPQGKNVTNTYVIDLDQFLIWLKTHSPITQQVEGRMTCLGTPPP